MPELPSSPGVPAKHPPPRLRSPGGTSGGVAEFLLGLALLVGGGYLFLDNVIVSTTGNWAWGWFGGNRPFGITLIPLFIGVAVLFFNGRSPIGWVLTIASVIVIFVGIIANLSVQWRPTSLYFTFVIIGLMAAGIGLIARSVRPH
jgi:hypothetical protein